MTRKPVRLIAFTLICSLGALGAASAQAPTVASRERYINTFTLMGDFGAGTDISLYSVTRRNYFRVTDVIVTNTSGTVCDFRFLGKTNEFTVQPRSTFTMSFVTGLRYNVGEEVILRNTQRLGGGASCGLVTVSGYTSVVD